MSARPLPQRERAFELLRGGAKPRDVSDEVGLPIETIYGWLRFLRMQDPERVPPKRNEPIPWDIRARALRELGAGKTPHEVAAMLGISLTAINNWRARAGMVVPRVQRVTVQDVERMLGQGMTQSAIALHFDVSRQRISQLAKGIARATTLREPSRRGRGTARRNTSGRTPR